MPKFNLDSTALENAVLAAKDAPVAPFVPKVVNPAIKNFGANFQNNVEPTVTGLERPGDDSMIQKAPVAQADQYFPIILPSPFGTQTPEQTASELEAAKRRRTLYIAGGVLAALIVLLVVLSMSKKISHERRS